MKALWLEDNRISLRDVRETRKPGEALIKIRKAGICSTDLELVKGYYPYTGIPGHEFVGEVVEADDPSWMGQRVVGEINVVCVQCEQCLNGRFTHCEKRTVLGIVNRDGTFAEFTQLPVINLHRVPDSISDEIAVFTEPLAAALEIQQQVQIKPTDRVLLIGAGRLGQLIAQTLALTGCDLRVVARHAHQQDLLKARGIKLIAEEDIQPWRWDIVVEATGSPDGFSLARRAIRPRGTLVMKSTYKGDLHVNFSSIVVDELNIIGSRCGPFEPALRLMESRQVDPTLLITNEFKLDEALKAFERAAEPGVLKVLVQA
ncbi:MAG TPA: alcohol dehydrogenase catalytic domain-containing protein [Anaerolineales bacterium]|nr:alcohol dehydrogenase catalytic domain-containing protein [Anaerolineales bacterium]